MKLRSGNSKQGGVLVITIVITALVGLMLTAYLGMVSSQHNFTQRSQVWNNAIPMAEAGIEEAMAHINHINTTSNFAINGWRLESGRYRRERYMNGGECRMEVDNSMPPIITVQGRLKEPVGNGNVTRAVRVQTKINYRFPNGILARGSVTLGGSGRIDSFNSTNPAQCGPNGQYALSNATDIATVATIARTNGAISVGNMTIYGSVATGPGGTATLSPNGNVGDRTYNNTPAFDGTVQPGHWANDLNVYIPPSTFPSDFAAIPQIPMPGPHPVLPPNTNYNYVVRDGDWSMNSINLSSSQKMIIAGKARLRVLGAISIGGQASIIITPGASLELYCYNVVNVTGAGCINNTGLAKNLSIIGMGSSPIYYGGGAGFCGTIYAPAATVTLSGSSDASGAIVANNFVLTGTMGLHYDEALKGDQREGRFLAASWQEIQL
jgi:hypothetical protein